MGDRSNSHQEPVAGRLLPTQPAERVLEIDVIRGVAILGILVVNMMYFAWPFYHELIPGAAWTSPADRVAEVLIWFFAESKFITMFSLMFGLGLAMLMGRAEAKGQEVRPLFVRRMLVLLLIGAVHTVLFWVHDILVYFALVGFLLLLFRRKEPASLKRWAAVVFLVPVVVTGAFVGLGALAATLPEGAAEMEAAMQENVAMFERMYEQALAVYSTGSFGEVTVQRIVDFGMEFVGGFIGGSLFVILGMFLLGLAAGKARWLQDPEAHVAAWRRVLRTAGPIGLIGSAVLVVGRLGADPGMLSWRDLATSAGTFIGAPAMCLAYVSAIVLLSRKARWRKLFRPLAAVGRTALSNYLLQSVICTTLFYGYGFGLFGQVGPAAGLALTVGIYALQVVLSNLYVQRFRYGPAELLWRKLTYRAV